MRIRGADTPQLPKRPVHGIERNLLPLSTGLAAERVIKLKVGRDNLLLRLMNCKVPQRHSKQNFMKQQAILRATVEPSEQLGKKVCSLKD